MRQEDFSKGRRVNLVEFFGCQCSFQARVRGMLNQCHEKNSISVTFDFRLHWFVAFVCTDVTKR
jgi:hypothetical protein